MESIIIALLVIVSLPYLLLAQIKLMLIWLLAGSNRIRLPKESAFQHADEYEQLMATEVEQEIQRLMPTGTSVHEAKKMMRRNGFRCEWTERRAHKQRRQSSLFCRRDDGSGILIERSWMIFLDYEQDLITNIQASTGLTGL